MNEVSSRATDYTGRTFGFLTVLGFSGRITAQGNYIWECSCGKCGAITYIAGGNLKNAISCGCYRSSLISPDRDSKRCNNCKLEKPISSFGKNKSRKDGHSQFCKDCIKAIDQKYRPRQMGWRATYSRNLRKSSNSFRIADNLRRRVNSALHGKSKSSSTTKLLGCSIESLLDYLKERFVDGMEIENYGEVWEIDHIVPCAKFDLSVPQEQLSCFHYTNLQPLFINDNRKKSSWHDGVHYGY